MNKNLSLLSELASELLRNREDAVGDFYFSECTLIEEDVKLLEKLSKLSKQGLNLYAVVYSSFYCSKDADEGVTLFIDYGAALAKFESVKRDAIADPYKEGWAQTQTSDGNGYKSFGLWNNDLRAYEDFKVELLVQSVK